MEPVDLIDLAGALWVWGANPRCPSCGGTDWGDSAHRTAVPEYDPETKALNYEGDLPALALVCQTCAFVRIHVVSFPDEDVVEAEENGEDETNGASGR